MANVSVFDEDRKLHAVPSAAAALALAITSTIFLTRALGQDRAGLFLAWMAAATVVGALAVWLFATRVLQAFTEPRERTLVATLLIVVGVAITALGVASGWSFLVPIGLLGPASSNWFLADKLSAVSVSSARRGLIRSTWLTLIAVGLWCLTEIFKLPTALRWAALLGWLVALVMVKISLPPLLAARGPSGVEGNRFVAVPTAVAIGGFGLFWAIGASSTLRLIGATAMAFGLTVASIGLVALLWDGNNRELKTWLRIGAIVGLLLAVAGFVGTQNLLPTWPAMAAAIVTVALVVGAFFVFRGEAVMGILMLGFVLTWAYQDTTISSDSVDFADSPTIIALGDSFTSGEGGDEFFPYTNTQGSDVGNRCRRSTAAYVEVLGELRAEPVRNFACSGAETPDITRGLDGSGEPRPEGRRTASGDHQVLEAVDGPYSIKPDAVETVLLGIGGNDVDFSTIVSACLLPVDCDTRQDELIANSGLVQAALISTYQTVIDHFPNAELVVVSYPAFAGETACDRALTTAEASTANTLVSELNRAVVSAAAAVNTTAEADRVSVFRIDDLFAGHTLCDEEPWVNFLQVRNTEGPLLPRLNPVPWLFGSAHPNPEGHRAIGEALHAWLDGDRTTPATATAPLAGDSERFDTDAWAVEQISMTLPTLAWNLGSLTAAGVLLAWWLVGTFDVPWVSPLRSRKGDDVGDGHAPKAGDVALAYADLPVARQPRWLRFLGHAQGIAVHHHSGSKPTIFVSTSISKLRADLDRWIPKLLSDRLSISNPSASLLYGYRATVHQTAPGQTRTGDAVGALRLGQTYHPGGIAILGNLLVTPCEGPRQEKDNPPPPDAPFLLFHELDPHTSTPTECAHHTLNPPECADEQHGNPKKASAAAMAYVGDDLYVVVLSENRYLRVLCAPGGQLDKLGDALFVDAGNESRWEGTSHWHADAVYDGVGLTVDDGVLTVHLLGLQPIGGVAQYLPLRWRRQLAFLLAIGTDVIVGARLSLDPLCATPLSGISTRTVRITPASISPVRPSFRWGGSICQVPNDAGEPENIVMMVESFGSKPLDNVTNALQFARSLRAPAD